MCPQSGPRKLLGGAWRVGGWGKWLRGRSGPQVLAVICDLHVVRTPSSTFYWQAVKAAPRVRCPGERAWAGPTRTHRPLPGVVLSGPVRAVGGRPPGWSGVVRGFLRWDSRETVCIYYTGKWHNPECNVQRNDIVGFEAHIVTRSKVSRHFCFSFSLLNLPEEVISTVNLICTLSGPMGCCL